MKYVCSYRAFFNREYCLEWLQLKHQLGTGRHFTRWVQPEYRTDLWYQGNSEVTVTDINNRLLIITVEEHYMYLLPKRKMASRCLKLMFFFPLLLRQPIMGPTLLISVKQFQQILKLPERYAWYYGLLQCCIKVSENICCLMLISSKLNLKSCDTLWHFLLTSTLPLFDLPW